MQLERNPHREDIKAAIRKRGTTLGALSKEAGRHKRTAANSLLRPIPSGNRLIANFLGLSLNYLWPSWYGPDGQRLLKPKSSRKSRASHSKKAA